MIVVIPSPWDIELPPGWHFERVVIHSDPDEECILPLMELHDHSYRVIRVSTCYLHSSVPLPFQLSLEKKHILVSSLVGPSPDLCCQRNYCLSVQHIRVV
jgi:hypothetical protein